jgi:hypothetical protein
MRLETEGKEQDPESIKNFVLRRELEIFRTH